MNIQAITSGCGSHSSDLVLCPNCAAINSSSLWKLLSFSRESLDVGMAQGPLPAWVCVISCFKFLEGSYITLAWNEHIGFKILSDECTAMVLFQEQDHVLKAASAWMFPAAAQLGGFLPTLGPWLRPPSNEEMVRTHARLSSCHGSQEMTGVSWSGASPPGREPNVLCSQKPELPNRREGL